ncbi:hypothetical protein [Sphingomonas xinjiangensis]|uniref:Uncharacterized protein n=1 Tax=Sphingomonas xinjiangensis TaxID=643568 RepID=A0A840YSJ5_9SPHN|nr:hypothetical protein [Sphingomonas xinjiangensis]MBB5712623.1 hypothetical protein [Sphingomonas xinjiangensis]
MSRIRSVLDFGYTTYGVLTPVLVATFAFSDVSTLRFMKLFSVLLFVIGSVLIVEGYLRFGQGWRLAAAESFATKRCLRRADGGLQRGSWRCASC